MGITDPTEPYFKNGGWGFDGTVWRKNNLLWGYHDRWYEDLGGDRDGDGTYTAHSTAVAAGYVHVVEFVSFRNITGSRGAVQLRAKVGVLFWILKYNATPVLNVPDIAYGPFTLKEGDQVTVRQSACLDNDELEAVVWGYKMRIDM